MPWKNTKGFDHSKKKELVKEVVDQLPLVTSSENVDSATPSGGSVSKSDSSPSMKNKRNSHLNNRHITTVTIRNGDAPQQQQQHQQQRRSLLNQEPPIISYEKNKSVRIIVKEPGFESPSGNGNRNSRLRDAEGGEYWKDPVTEKNREANSWVANQTKPISKHHEFTTPEKLKDGEGIKVRPLLETSWRSSSRASVLDEPPSDDCQRSTSTLVNTNPSKIGRTTSECQRGCISLFCGISVVIGSAVCLRLPGLLHIYGVGSFSVAFNVCLLFVAVPLAYLECGLAQFSNNSVIGIWSLVPLSRGIGWSTVVGCLYWGATTAGLAAPWFHYLIAQNDPDILQIPSTCRLLNGTDFDAVNYYRHCVYNLSSTWEGGVDLSLTWSLPAGLIAILMLASISVAGGPILMAFISATGSLLAVIGYGTQFYVAFSELTTKGDGIKFEIQSLLELLIPDPETLIRPQVWLAAMSQALLCLGPGVGMLLNHSANNVFRHPLKRHLWFLTTLTILATTIVTLTTTFETMLFSSHFSSSRNFNPVTEQTDDFVNSTSSLLHSELKYTNSTFFTDNESYVIVSPNKTNNCVLFSYSLADFSCTNVPPGLTKGIPFIIASHLASFSMSHYPIWLSSLMKNLIFLGFLGAGVATACVCMHVGVVAAREARSLPPAVAALVLMAVLSLVAAPMSTQAGASLIQLVDHYVLMPGLLWPPVATLIALATCHGVTKIRKDMTFMLESVVSWFWLPIWALVLPLLLLGVTVWSFYFDWQELGLVQGPEWRLAIVWSLRIGLLISMPVTAVIVINSQLAYGFKDKVLSSLQSSREWGDWGPQDPIEHHNWRRWREDETRSYASLERRLASKSRPLTYTHSTLSSSSSSTLARLRAKYRGQIQACDL